MIDRVEEQFSTKPEYLFGDSAHGTAPMPTWMLEEKAIEPHVPVRDKTGEIWTSCLFLTWLIVIILPSPMLQGRC